MARLRQSLPGGLLLLSWSLVAAAATPVQDLYFAEALYHAYRGDHFDAIVRLDIELEQYGGVDEPQLDSLHFHAREAEFSVGDFELHYRMHNRAGRAVSAVLEGAVAPAVRNEAAYRLARILFQKGESVEAQRALDRIDGDLPARIADDVGFLRAQVYLANGQFDDAVAVLRALQGSREYAGFAGYNLGIALLWAGQQEEALAQLARAGQRGTASPPVQAIRDRANLVLGTRLMEAGDYRQAHEVLDRVRLRGPFSNRALLSAGWAYAALEHYERALVPWTVLAERNITDRAVQEALLALPYAYGKLEAHGKAAQLYRWALDGFAHELARLDASVRSIREGRFLQALLREELKQDSDWVLKLRELPQTPETYYLVELLASHDFQESLRNYLDLEDLRRRTAAWDDYLDAYEELIEHRRAYYQPLLPVIDREFRTLDSQLRLRLEQREHVAQQLHALLTAPRHEYLITAPERELRDTLNALARRLSAEGGGASDYLARVERLQGVLRWDIATDYHRRLTAAFANLRALDEEIAHGRQAYAAFVRTRQAATQSYQGYEATLHSLRLRGQAAQERIVALMVRQGALLEAMAIAELETRRQRLEEYQVKARFALADSYDRAVLRQSAEPAPQ